jgi:trehalose 6-phosphate phosphatase
VTDQLIERLANADRLLVASDFDGVLAPIVEDPDNTAPLAESLGALRDLADAPNTIVAVVSGRNYDVLQQLVAPADRFILVGSHGAEMGAVALETEEQQTFDRFVHALEALVEEHPGLHIEVKTVSVAAHFRRVEVDYDAAVAAVELLSQEWPGKIVTGKEVVEFTLRHATKGDAVSVLAAEHQVDMTVYFGDDVTDETVFMVLGPDDVGVKVGEGQSAASHRLATPVDVASLLTALAARRTGRGEA